MVVPDQRSDGMEKFNWSARKKRGDAAEQRFIDLIQDQHQLHVVYTGQHLHNPKSQLARHFPDIFIVEKRAFVQVKDGSRSGKWPHVIGEVASIDACRELYGMDNNVWVVWKYPDDSFHGNKIQLLVIDGYISDLARQRGAGTPAYKIRKSSLCKLTELLYCQKTLFG